MTTTHFCRQDGRLLVKGANGYFHLARLETHVQGASGETPATVRVEGYGRNSGWRPPFVVESSDPAVLRRFAQVLRDAAEALEQETLQPQEEKAS